MVDIPITFRYIPLGERTFPDVHHPETEGGVTIVAFQVHKDTAFSLRVTKQVTGAAHCATTGVWIPVLAWNKEIEKAFRGFSKEVHLEPTSRTFTRRFWIVFGIIALTVALGAAAIGYLIKQELGPNSFQLAQERVAEVAASPEAGDRIAVPAMGADPEQDAHTLWYVIRSVSDEAVDVQAYDALVADAYGTPELDPERFTGQALTIDAEAFMENSMLGNGEPILVYNALPADD